MSWCGADSNVRGPIGCPKGYIGLDFSTTQEWKPSTPEYIKEVENFYSEMYDKMVLIYLKRQNT